MFPATAISSLLDYNFERLTGLPFLELGQLSFQIFVNDKPLKVEAKTSVEDVLLDIGIKEFAGVAVALENSVVSRENWQSTYFKPEQALVVFTAAQGG